MGGVTPEEFLAHHPIARAVFEEVKTQLAELGPVEVRATKSQIAFRRTRGFAYLWLPGQYLSNPAAEVVLSIALGRADSSPRWKEVAHPAAAQWVHHLEVHGPEEIDFEVVEWLREAAERA